MTKLRASDLISPGPTPGKFRQAKNYYLQQYPIETVHHGLIWSFLLLVVSPLLGTFMLLKTTAFVVLQPFFLFNFGGTRAKVEVGKNSKFELAVCITGCDSGFGKLLASKLSSRGFVVFAGCLTEGGMKSVKNDGPSIIPLKMDVTKDEDVTKAAESISAWLKSDDASPEHPRAFHALINNAGVARIGLIDWLDFNEFKFSMDVNFFGMVRTCKALFPILKSQSCSGKYTNARIINVTSSAGLISGIGGLAAYHASKFAAEAFSTSLRTELKKFNVPVCAVNPTFHRTPLLDNAQDGGLGGSIDIWNRLSPEIQKEYGEDFFKFHYQTIVDNPNSNLWDPDMVIEKIMSCVELCNPPVQNPVGTDCIKIFLIRHLPVTVQDFCIKQIELNGRKHEPKPAMLL
eukprot:CAMPEP_0194354280 /NCGR_PEP_ID=MMETSP0174-20130528/2472_1 /TAXON_ID=216777 /ORGANISM="Proboscia alata, Strain PI-D3" /LENGTH=401 /DNA_ID=CAMNT_0039123177 /DNA_START=206 /DNA_END=1411 /DNA_ORIENTATION=+